MTDTTPPRTGGSIVDSSKQFLKEGSQRLRALFKGGVPDGAPISSNSSSTTAAPPPATANAAAEPPKRKKSIFAPADKPDPNSIEAHLLHQAKEKNTDVNEVIKNANISSPYDVEHKVKVRFDEANIRYSGIPDGWAAEAHRQFGIPLPTCPRVEVPGYADRIPIVLVRLRDRFVELDGPKTDGVFRLAPDGQDVTDVKKDLNTGQALASLQTTKDPHVVANLIKQFYRELQPKILSSLSKEAILEMAPINDHSRIAAYVAQLPEPNQSVFLWLLDLLCDVAANQDTNRMTPTNLAIVLSPNLYDASAGTEPIEELMLSQKVAAVACNALKWRIASRG